MKHHLDACDLYEAAGHTTIPVPISEVREMAARIGKAKITTKDGRTKIEPVKKYASVSQRIGGKAKADRKEAGYRRNAARGKG